MRIHTIKFNISNVAIKFYSQYTKEFKTKTQISVYRVYATF